jgi:transposase
VKRGVRVTRIPGEASEPGEDQSHSRGRVKTDKLDGKILAHLLGADLIAECYVPTRDVRLSRALLSHRVNIT